MTQTLNIDIFALSSQMSEHIQLWGQASFAAVYNIVSLIPEHCEYWTCGIEFQKLFSSFMLLNKLRLFDRVTQASLVRVLTSYHRSVHLSMADSPLSAVIKHAVK